MKKIGYYYGEIVRSIKNSRYIDYVIKHGPEIKEIEIETLNRCNGKCSFCPVNALEPQRKYAKMSERLFEKIINELAEGNYSDTLSLYSNNEPFLDERIIDFYKYAREKLPNAKLSLFTNGSLLTLDKFKKIVDCLDSLTIDNYNDAGIVNENLKEVHDYLNENSEYKNKVHFKMRLENEILFSRGGQAPNKKEVKFQLSKCLLPYRQLVIRPDGKVSLCCNDALGKYTLGDVNTSSVYEIWHSKAYNEIRKEMKKHGRRKLMLCKNCDTKTLP